MKALPTLRQLRFLTAVVEKRHFGRAAEMCSVGQSTLSAGIQELEELLGVRLLERSRRSVAPTPVGREIATRAKSLLASAEELADLAQAARDPMSGSLNLGVIPTIGPFLLPRIMPRLRDSFPDLKLYLREDQTARLLDRIETGELDAAIIALPYPFGDIETVEIGRDPFWVVCPAGHRLAHRRAIRPDDIATEDLLLLEEGHCLRDQALAACSLEGARRNSAFRGTSLHTLVQMTANGLGVTIAPRMAIDAGLLRGLDVSAAPLRGDEPFRRIGLGWRRGSGRSETFARLADALRESIGQNSDES